MIPYSKSKLNFRRNLPSETYHPKKVFFDFLIIKLFFQDKNVFASKTLKNFKKFSETYLLKLTIPNFCKTK